MKCIVGTEGEEFCSDGGSPLRWSEFHASLRESAETRAVLTKRLRQDKSESYYFECAPWFPGADPIFRFVTVPAPSLRNRRVDSRTFSDHLAKATKASATFTNLRGDSVLVVPTPATRNVDQYGHLASWIRGAADAAVNELWIALADAIGEWRRSSEPLWVSTSGGGVAWVHFRLDPRPKYYKHAPFRSS